jgi:hypothetical protein
MRRQAFIARLGTAAAVLLKVVRVGAAAALALLSVLPAFPQDRQDATLACDRAATSPTDKNRQFGVPAVFFASINPQVAIPACQEAAAAEPENPRILFQLGRAYAAAEVMSPHARISRKQAIWVTLRRRPIWEHFMPPAAVD